MHGTVDDALQVVQLEGLGQVVKSTQLHRFHGSLHTSIACDHDDLRQRMFLAAFLDNLQAVHVRNPQVNDEKFRLDPLQSGHAFPPCLK